MYQVMLIIDSSTLDISIKEVEYERTCESCTHHACQGDIASLSSVTRNITNVVKDTVAPESTLHRISFASWATDHSIP